MAYTWLRLGGYVLRYCRLDQLIRYAIFSSMDLGEVGWGDVDWIGLAQGRNRWRALVNSVLNLGVP
jgi:hypothetical protein